MGNAMIPAIGLIYVVLFGGLSLLRNEGLPVQMAIEALVITFFASGVQLLGVPIHPTIFFLLLYALTMRGRLLSDLGNMFTRRRQYHRANSIFNFALRLWPDKVSQRVIRINQAITFLRVGDFRQAEALFRQLLAELPAVDFPAKLEAAVHYNLALTLRYAGDEPAARIEFRRAMESAPKSLYAYGAETALRRKEEAPERKSNETHPDDDDIFG